MKKCFFVLIVISLLLGGLLVGFPDEDRAVAERTIRAGMLLEGPVQDAGWNLQCYLALKRLEEKYGWEVAYTDHVSTEDMEDMLRFYAMSGFDVVFAPGAGYQDALLSVAPHFPDTKFVQINAKTLGPDNLASAGFVAGELGYIVGVTLGFASKTETVGLIGGQETAVMSHGFNLAKEVAQEINPDISVTISYVGSWDDPARAKEMANAYIDRGADIIVSCAGSGDLGVLEAAEEARERGREAWVIGWVSDFYEMAPDVVMTSAVMGVGDLLELMGDKIAAGEFEPKHYVFGLADGANHLAPFRGSVSPEVEEKILEILRQYMDGELEIPTREDL